MAVIWVSAFAQSDRGTITGTVADSTGALVPNANITLTNSNTGTKSTTATTGTGNYTVLALPAGTYTLTIEQSGFSKYQQTNNGGNNNFKIMFEGQESDSARQTRVSDELQPSVESIEQFTLQTSNFSAEFGRVGNGGVYNFTSKSGTNRLHGSVYTYFENTFLNAGIPFTNDGQGQHIKVVKHLADYGGSIGGPVWIPRIYNGKNKTFFFFNLEKYRDRESLYAGTSTVPNGAYLRGDLSNNLLVTGNRNLGTDFAGRSIIQNAIYDPATQTLDGSGRRVLNVFPNNIIPSSRIDPTVRQILAFLPKANIGHELYEPEAVPPVQRHWPALGAARRVLV